ncbi:chromosome partitioning protein [Lentzea sp. JNUCC 0626]|uniref:chromosome partitioning protein n=1 Tax=Lentzea sp. JNUCC 0626 TaxID=3367513 RepID=UPI003748BA0A
MLIAVLSLKGSPGVTTFSVAMAARWPDPAHVLLVEADPAGGDLATRFSLPPSPGLLSLAAGLRTGGTDPYLPWQHAQPLRGGLPTLTAPPDADQARAALLALAPTSDSAFGVLRIAGLNPGSVVVVDCGRVGHGSPAMGIIRQADVLVLLTRADADHLSHLARKLAEIGRWAPRAVLLLAGNGHSVPDVARELGVTPRGRVPHDARGASVLCGRPRPWWSRSGPAHSALGRFAHKMACSLASTPALPLRHQAFSLPGLEESRGTRGGVTP